VFASVRGMEGGKISILKYIIKQVSPYSDYFLSYVQVFYLALCSETPDSYVRGSKRETTSDTPTEQWANCSFVYFNL
jgi:hypothetical protein